MSVHVLRREQRLPGAPEEVFPFFGDARNLGAITPPLLQFRMLTPDPIVMAPGTQLRYRLRVRGVPVSWLTEIRAWDPPYRFVDEQLEGPYALWHHTHTFEDDGAGGTIMRDEVRYELPLGLLGELAHRLLVRRDLARIFDYRAERVPALLSEVARRKAPAADRRHERHPEEAPAGPGAPGTDATRGRRGRRR
jgi:ligand-binding SRPBCC domain-containing protein